MALATVQEYVTTARAILQDATAPYRFSDAQLAIGLSLGLQEARRIRPDLYIGRFATIPNFTVVDATAVTFEEQYRIALVYYMVGHCHLFDEEETEEIESPKEEEPGPEEDDLPF